MATSEVHPAMHAAPAHVLRTAYSAYAYYLSDLPIGEWEHTDTETIVGGTRFSYERADGYSLEVDTGGIAYTVRAYNAIGDEGGKR